MKLSIIVLNWNSCEWLIKFCNSLREFPPEVEHELIIVDQGSSDDSDKFIDTLLKQYPYDVIPIINSENIGISSGRNQGAEIAIGDFVLFCDSDIEFCESGWFQKMLATYEKNPDCGLVGPYTNYANGYQQQSIRAARSTKRLAGRYQLVTFCILTPLDIAKAIEWNAALSMYNGIDWVRRVISEGWMSYIAPTYVKHHGHKSLEANKVDFNNVMSRSSMIFEDLWKNRNPHLNWCESAIVWSDGSEEDCELTLPFLQALRVFSPHLTIDVYTNQSLYYHYPDLYDHAFHHEINMSYDICFQMPGSSFPWAKSKWFLTTDEKDKESIINLLRYVGYNGGTPKVRHLHEMAV